MYQITIVLTRSQIALFDICK